MAMREEKQAYLDGMVRERGYVLDYHKVMAEHDLEVLRAADGLVRATYREERRLDRKTKELIFVATLTVLRTGKAHLKSHIQAALDHGASEGEVLEAIEITLPQAGVVVFQEGFHAWREVVKAEGVEPSVETHDFGPGRE